MATATKRPASTGNKRTMKKTTKASATRSRGTANKRTTTKSQ